MINLAQLPPGQPAKVVGLEGGLNLRQRLQNLGIRKGIIIRKEKGMLARGPIVVKAGGTQIALGRGMASKVMVEAIQGIRMKDKVKDF